ncbi:MAG: hypothetical protein C0399_01400 [Syntrophus sp. (in: bacteria)]|nr:hypothetical protein [Syntrophus sp. (in: bacteria)]
MEKTHSLLKRQIKKVFGDSLKVPEEWQGFIEMVNNAYHEFDIDRNMLERSLELSSQELLQTNSEMRAIFEAIPDLFFRLDYSGTILDCKAGNTKDLYVSRQKLIGHKIHEIPVKFVKEQLWGTLEGVKQTLTPMSIEYSLILQEREHFYEARFIPLLEDQIIVLIRNVTGRKMAETALRESEEKYRSIFENSVEGIFQTTPEGRLINANPSLARMFGYGSPEEMITSSSWVSGKQFVVLHDAARFVELIGQFGILQGFETQMHRKDKNRIWVSINAFLVPDKEGGILCYEGTVENITDRKRAEEALFESEEKYRSIIEESHVGVYIIQDGLFSFVNRRFCEIHGYAYAEIVGKLGPKDFVLPVDWPLVEESLKKRYLGEVKTAELTHHTQRKDGEVRTVKIIGSTILYRNKPAIIGTLLDISKEQVLEEKLLQSQKLETVGRLAGGIAHDFNNMLGIILGNTQLAKLRVQADDKIFEYCSEIEQATSRAASFVRQLLAFSRRQVLELKIIDLNGLLVNFEKMIYRVIGEHIEMSIIYADEAPTIKADDTQIQQVLLNLVVNAREAMPEGGTLTISTSVAFIDEEYAGIFPGVPAGRYALLSVKDTGIGITKEVVGKIFEPFFTTKATGNGLGLSVVYGIVKQHDGFINIETKPGQETTFHIYLPSVAGSDGKKQQKDLSIMRGNETILIVEDDDEYRKVTTTFLQRLGYKVYSAAGGIEGLEIFKENNKAIDLVILDVIMPKMSGREALEVMRTINPSIHALFITGYSFNDMHSSYIPEEGVNTLQKPFSFDALSHKIREIMEQKK